MALLSNAPRNATVRTLTPATLIALPRGQFNNLLGRSPGVRARLEETFTRRRLELSNIGVTTAHRADIMPLAALPNARATGTKEST
jgi:CRP-like cAMP-binding protein